MTYEEKERHRKRRRFKVRERKDWITDRQRKDDKKNLVSDLDSVDEEMYRKYKLNKILPLDE